MRERHVSELSARQNRPARAETLRPLRPSSAVTVAAEIRARRAHARGVRQALGSWGQTRAGQTTGWPRQTGGGTAADVAMLDPISIRSSGSESLTLAAAAAC